MRGLFLALALWSSSASAQTSPEAVRLLREATTFEHARVGMGVPSQLAEALRVLLRQPGAIQIFDRLWREGTTVTRLYVLAAYWYLAPDRFHVRRDELLRREGDVIVEAQGGCDVYGVRVRDEIGGCARDEHARPIGAQPGTDGSTWGCALEASGVRTFCCDLASGCMAIQLVENPPIRPDWCARSDRPRVVLGANGALCTRGFTDETTQFPACQR